MKLWRRFCEIMAYVLTALAIMSIASLFVLIIVSIVNEIGGLL